MKRALLMRRLYSLAVFITAACVAVSCRPTVQEQEQRGGSGDQIQGTGLRGFFWLPPLAPEASYGTFAPGLAPIVIIEQLPLGSKPPVATFTTTSGPHNDQIKTDGTSQYMVEWHAKRSNLDPSATYRIRVMLESQELGFLDLDIVENGKKLHTVATDQYFPLAENRTLPIKFRIEQDASACLKGPSLTEADSGSSVALGRDELLTVTLEGLNSAGYQWMVSGIDAGMLKLAGSEHVGGSSPGRLDKQILHFAGVGKGTSTLTVGYRRPWESTAPPSRTFELSVTVQGKYTGCYREPVAPARASKRSPLRTTALPSAFTYCDSNSCTPVKDQGPCGSCWAFATVGVMEQVEKKVDGVERDLSEQHLVSCTNDSSRFRGCQGGWEAFDYYDTLNDQMNAVGTVYERDFPYVAADAACRMGISHHERIASWERLANSETDTLKQALVDHGPIWVTVCADPAFQNYQGGMVFNGTTDCTNHAVVITGWDDGTQSWLIRNSWGQGWGDRGYMRIAYGANGIGRVASAVTYTSRSSNDFSIVVTPSSQSVPAGSSVSYTLITATTSGSDENISLSVSGLPAGVTGTLSSSSVNSGDLAVLTLTVAPCTAPTAFTFTVTGRASSAIHSASATLAVQEGCGGGSGDQKLPLSVHAFSGACPDNPPSWAIDGDPSTFWNACDWPSQFIEVDLGGVAQVSRIRLLTDQYPDGLTTHRLWGRDSYGNWTVYYGDITGYTTSNQWLELTTPWTPPVRYLLIETSEGPSWVSWREIEVYGTY